MLKKEFVVKDVLNHELKKVTAFAVECSGYQSRITLRTDEGTDYNAKSILSVLSATFSGGDTVVLTVEGADEEEAFDALTEFFIKLFLSE